MANDTVYIEKNQPAPYTGILFTEKKAQDLRTELLESDKTKVKLEHEQFKNIQLTEIIKLDKEEIELYRKQNRSLLRQEQTSETMRYIWFGLGVLVTGAAVYGAGGLAR